MSKAKKKTPAKKTATKKAKEYPLINELLPIIESVVERPLEELVSNAIDGEVLRCVLNNGTIDVDKIEAALSTVRVGDQKLSDLISSTAGFLSEIKKSSK
jgi:hypothetical protein